MTVEPEMLMAYLDGELDARGRAEVEQALASDPELRAELELQRALRARLRSHYGPVASEAVPERLKAMLGAPAPQPKEEERIASLSEVRRRRPSLPLWGGLTAVAASFALGLVAGPRLLPGTNGPVGIEDGTLVAEGALAQALETQLASAPAPDASVRIGITFADQAGRACRTFEAQAFAGLACRTERGWAMAATAAVPDRPSGPYRQASSPVVMAAAQEMMAGTPLDAEAERAARDAGWKMD